MNALVPVARTGTQRLSALFASACLAASAWAAPATPSTPADTAGDVKMDLLPSGATQKLGGYNPQQVKMVKGKPAAMKKQPDMKSPLYGQIRFGGKNYFMAVDEPTGGEAKLYVDANANGDLTDDPQTTWEQKTGTGPNGTQLTQYSGSFELPLGTGDNAPRVTLMCYRFDPKDPQRQQLKTTFLYYADYAYEGEVTLAGQKYKAMLVDMQATGDVDARPAAAEDKPAAANAGALRFLIDINGDGTFTPKGEMYESNKPFNVKGTTWELAFGGAPEGAPFKVVKSNKKVAEVALPPNHSVGAKITPFKAKRLDGKAVSFPDDYKGKVVMLDFWATWCPPCREEIPGLMSAYNAHHGEGFEVLGISLDQNGQANQVKAFMKEQGMTWPQVYDGKFWKAAVADLYNINSIPACFLVDGDTGVILARDGQLRGGNLETTIQAALEKKSNKSTDTAGTARAKEKADAAPAAEKPADAPEAKPEPPATPDPKPEQKDAVPF
jgi:thiol-disulfide isomerase/thioredoxin